MARSGLCHALGPAYASALYMLLVNLTRHDVMPRREVTLRITLLAAGFVIGEYFTAGLGAALQL